MKPKMPADPAVAEMYEFLLRRLPTGTKVDVIVKETPEFKIRQWIGVRLIALAAWVLNCEVEIDITPPAL